MTVLRKFGVFLASLALGSLLSGLVFFTVFRVVFGTPDNLKNWTKQSGAYESFVDILLEQTKKEAGSKQPGELPIDEPAVLAVAKQAFSPVLLQQTSESVLDGTYRWLNGTARQPEFKIDFAPAKREFAEGIGNYVATRFQSLPLCSLQNIPQTLDIFRVECRPPGVDAQVESQRIVAEILQNKDFLGEPVLTPETFKSKDATQTVFERYDHVPGWFRLAKIAPFILFGLSLLAAALIIVLSQDHQSGLKRVARQLLSSGFFVAISLLLLKLATNNLQSRAPRGVATQDNAQQVGLRLLEAANQSLTGLLVMFVCLYLGFGILLLLISRRMSNSDTIKV